MRESDDREGSEATLPMRKLRPRGARSDMADSQAASANALSAAQADAEQSALSGPASTAECATGGGRQGRYAHASCLSS